jgi:1,2-diacylglycerol 3-alpha-glucosyltransferase
MKIGIFVDCYLPTKNGVVTSIVQAREALARRGHKTIVFTVEMPGYEDQEEDVYRFPSLPFSSRLEIRAGLPEPRAILRLARQAQIDVVHTHSEAALGWAGKWVGRALRLPRVHTTHSDYGEFRHYLPGGEALSSGTIQWFLSRFLSGYDALVCPSLKSKQFFGSFLPTLEMVVIGNGASRERFQAGLLTAHERQQARARLGIGPADRVILYVGRLAQEKRTVELLDALAPLLRARPGTKALWVGTGPDEARLVRQIQQLGLQGQVILAGTVPWEQMPDIYALADAYTSASLSEIHPMTLIEATLCGLPAVVRDDLSCVDLVEQGHNGYRVETDAEIAVRLAELLADEARLRQFSAQAYALSDRLTIDAHALQLEALYTRLKAQRLWAEGGSG